MLKYFSLANVTAGLIAVVVGFISSAAIIFQAAASAGANSAEITSWIFALGMSTAFSCIGLSWYYRMPILTAWSTPGAALLVTGLSGMTLPQASGIFVFAGFLTLLVGITGLFEKALHYIPRQIAAAMLAGILLHFGMNVFIAMQDQYLLVGSMMASYFLGKRFLPRFVMVLVLCTGLLVSFEQGLLVSQPWQFTLSHPVLTMPQFSLSALIGVGIPLFVVTMTSQNIPGIAVLHAAGYKPPISTIISWIGVSNLICAPFGGFSCNLAALTAAICVGEEAGSDPGTRYRAVICAGFFYLLMGLFAATVVGFFTTFPKVLVMSVAGLALFGTIGSNLQAAFRDDHLRDSALITLMVTISGIQLFGVSSAFWGLLAGLIADKLLMKPRVAEVSV